MQRAPQEAQGHGFTDGGKPQEGGEAESAKEGTADDTHWQAVKDKTAGGGNRAQGVKQKTSDAINESLGNTEELMFGRKA